MDILARILALSLLVACPASASVVANLSFEELVKRSDVVVIATKISSEWRRFRLHNDIARDLEVITLQVKNPLKGDVESSIKFLPKNGVYELDVDCCKAGKNYIFLLRTADGIHFESVNGKYGVIEIGE